MILHNKISLYQKISLIIFGIFLFLLSLEMGLRLSGFILLSFQEYGNRISINRNGTYRIICLGESTTADGGEYSYPNQLEVILNAYNTGIKFNVINKGVGGARTSHILSQLEYNLDKYNPDMVITMMGINDGGTHMPHEDVTYSKTILFLRSLKIYKLTRLIFLHMAAKINELGPSKLKTDGMIDKGGIPLGINLYRFYDELNGIVQKEEVLKKNIALNPKNEEAYRELKEFYQDISSPLQAEESFKEIISLNPGNEGAYRELGEFYQDIGSFIQAEEVFKKAISLNPGNDETYYKLGELHLDMDNLIQAEESFKKAISLNPMNEKAYESLGEFYLRIGNHIQAEEVFKKAISLNPMNEEAYRELGKFYLTIGNLIQAEEFLKKAISINPMNENAYKTFAGEFYLDVGNPVQAGEIFKKAIKHNFCKGELYGALAVSYQQMKMDRIAQKFFQKATMMFGYYKPITIINYYKLKKILDKRGIKLVCVQYPEILPLSRPKLSEFKVEKFLRIPASPICFFS